MRPNRTRPARAARLTCPTQAKQSLPRARKGALRALIAGKNKPETAPGAPVQRRRRAQEVETVAVPPPKKKGKAAKKRERLRESAFLSADGSMARTALEAT